MQITEILTDAEGKELTEHGKVLFPMSVYDNSMWALPTRSVPWHWHDACEIVRVRDGILNVEGPGINVHLVTGQAAFINVNVLHAMHGGSDCDCLMTNILFEPEILAGAPFSIFHSKYILPLCESEGSPLIPLFGESDWEKNVLAQLERLEEAFSSTAFSRELHVRSVLGDLWLLLLEHVQNAKPQAPLAADPHIRGLLCYIHEHYSEPLTLEMIAASAGISPRSCNRSFRTQLGMSVFDYVLEYRISQACELLVRSSESITEICFAVGFNDPSHFARTFRSLTGVTPRVYRRSAQQPEQSEPSHIL